MQLSAKNFGLAAGILWSLSMLIMTLINLWTGYGTQFLDLMVSIYPGDAISYVGSLIGLVYGFFDGFIGGFLLNWIYNKLQGAS